MNIKICGLTREEDVALATSLGAWALGFIFYPKSPRYIAPDVARQIKTGSATPATGVFVNQVDDVLRVATEAALQGVQLHGDETPDDCARIKKAFGGFVIKAFRPKSPDDIAAIPSYKGFVDFILIDAAGAAYGGTGQRADWALAADAKKSGIPLILAGGINPDNIGTAASTVAPFALDLSSGIEDSPGIKNHEHMKRLFETAKGFSS